MNKIAVKDGNYTMWLDRKDIVKSTPTAIYLKSEVFIGHWVTDSIFKITE